MEKKTKKKIILVALFYIVVLLLFFSCRERYFFYNTPGGCQVLGTNDELYIFVEAKRMRQSLSRFYDAPSRYAVDSKMYLVKVKKDGTYSENAMPMPEGFEIHPNFSHILYYDKGIYFMTVKFVRGHVKNEYFKLVDNNLVKSSVDNKVFHEVMEKDAKGINYPNIDLYSKKNGATVILADMSLYGETFIWNDVKFEFKVPQYQYEDETFQINIHASPLFKEPVAISVPVEFDRKKDEFDK